ncbi:type 1 periplasmic binding fold superfamily protein [Flavobacteriaceae bacterium F08102]|nr:type 1 periplasmic binding fold superfamily protein [Flavobacteriaceae bacterium F08102]
MKKYTYILLFAILGLANSCDDQDDPIPVNEEEVITTVRLTLTPKDGGTPIVLESRDLDGIGPDEPIITVSSTLEVSQVYSGNMELLNETVSPADQITEEVEEEGAEHQFFFQLSQDVADISYDDEDVNGNPIGLSIVLETKAVGTSNLTITLRHEPEKTAAGVAEGDISQAGGETDVQVVFPIEVI